jgi:hypothetical protein
MGRAKSYKPPTIEELQQEALKYDNRGDFSRGSRKHYRYAWCNGLLEQICAHMPDQRKKWTIEELKEEALKYERRIDFQDGCSRAYQVARYHGVLDEVCVHMRPTQSAAE